ncbi:unnamed protein product [Vitrella brassicaformis CCMP3155]|uniref:Serine aminopeptidase S33 domain-containing protein n=1 Tax=Vitrella brassicaformis (strain CCMP3155) TaxID=1169540 RepID=A0A0G4ERV7_VITBC|nr:unnamed protein product [Vitrella brassicaformis CCMP3155]|eukprot:CEM00789.1 unnamed protein product [Vitrella brassicaformis CCMP3155]
MSFASVEAARCVRLIKRVISVVTVTLLLIASRAAAGDAARTGAFIGAPRARIFFPLLHGQRQLPVTGHSALVQPKPPAIVPSHPKTESRPANATVAAPLRRAGISTHGENHVIHISSRTLHKHEEQLVNRRLLNCRLRLSEAPTEAVRRKWRRINRGITFFVRHGRHGSFRGANGVRIVYRAFPHYDSEGALLPGVVVATGWSECHVKYGELIRDLYRAGFSVFTFDHRCQGLSGHELGEGRPWITHVERFHHYTDDLTTFVNEVVKATPTHRSPAIARTRPAPPLFYVAHSMGAFIGLVAQHNSKQSDPPSPLFCRMALSAPMLAMKTPAGPNRFAIWLARIAILAGRKIRSPLGDHPVENPELGARITHDDDRKSAWERMRGMLPRTMIRGPSFNWIKEGMKAGFRFKKQWRRFDTPTVVFLAGIDDFVWKSPMRKFCYRAHHTQLVEFPHAYHNLLSETDSVRTPLLLHAVNFFRQAIRHTSDGHGHGHGRGRRTKTRQ